MTAPDFRRLFVLFVLALVVVYFAMIGAIYAFQRPLLYNASPDTAAPEALGINDATEVTFSSGDGTTLAGWYRPSDAGKQTILFFHGKGGNLGHRHARWKKYAENGFGILFFDYRGFGKSGGSPTEIGLKIDSLAAYDWLRDKEIAAENIVLTGESMGTGLAVYTASQRQVARVGLMAGYSSIADVATTRYWFAPVQILIKDRFDTLTFAEQINVPVLLQHGESDKTIPIVFAERLATVLKNNVTFVRRAGKGHNDFALEDFEREILFLKAASTP